MSKMIAPDFLKEKNINPDFCDIYWLAGMTAEEYRDLAWPEKRYILKSWGRYWPLMRAMVKAIKGAQDQTLLWHYHSFLGKGGRINFDAAWKWEGKLFD